MLIGQSPGSHRQLDDPLLEFQLRNFMRVQDAILGPDPVLRAEFCQKHFRLPPKYQSDLDPLSSEYLEQQMGLWRKITGRDAYNPIRDEDTPEIGSLDFIDRPSFYPTADSQVAGDHLIALGHIVKQSRLKAGARVLEYGAGFGQVALAFATLGAEVHTVDINAEFCHGIMRLARRYKVNLRAHVGEFDFVPGEQNYDLIYFYESFHHCLHFTSLMPLLTQRLASGGRIMLAGEPIADGTLSVPYPWGLRLDCESVAVMRQRGWLELGFQESFLMKLFVSQGLVWSKYLCDASRLATVYVLQKRPKMISLAHHRLTNEGLDGWHIAEPSGRWTKGLARLTVDASFGGNIRVAPANYHPAAQRVELRCAEQLLRWLN